MDTLTKAMAFNDFIRIYACSTTTIVRKAQERHGLFPSSCDALGRCLTATILTAMLKEENVTVKINGGGPIGDIVCEATTRGAVRGYCDDPTQFYKYNEEKGGKLNVSYAVGTDGELQVSTVINNELFTSSAQLQTGEIAYDFTYYFAASEQIPSSMGLGVLVNDDNTVNAAGGFLVQVLPGCPDEILTMLEERLKEIDYSEMLKKGLSNIDVIDTILGSDFKIIDEKIPLFWRCRCCKTKFKNALKMFKLEEIDDMIKEGKAEITCRFCNERFEFNKEELIEIKEEKENNK